MIESRYQNACLNNIICINNAGRNASNEPKLLRHGKSKLCMNKELYCEFHQVLFAAIQTPACGYIVCKMDLNQNTLYDVHI